MAQNQLFKELCKPEVMQVGWHLAQQDTFRRWVRKEQGVNTRPGKGRPRIAMVIRELVVEMAKETG